MCSGYKLQNADNCLLPDIKVGMKYSHNFIAVSLYDALYVDGI